jgi:hypothetical protein
MAMIPAPASPSGWASDKIGGRCPAGLWLTNSKAPATEANRSISVFRAPTQTRSGKLTWDCSSTLNDQSGVTTVGAANRSR